MRGGQSLADYRYDEGLRIRKSGGSPCLKANMHKMVSNGDLSNAIYVIGTTKSDTAKGTNCRSWVHDPKGIVGALTSTDYKQPKQIIVRAVLTPDRLRKRQNGRRIKENGEPMFTLTAQDRHGVAIKDSNSYRIRKLTPKECWRLQGWNDEDFEKAAKVCSDSQLYKQAGNGVTVTVICEIAKKL